MSALGDVIVEALKELLKILFVMLIGNLLSLSNSQK